MYAVNVQQNGIDCLLENLTKQFHLCGTKSSAIC